MTKYIDYINEQIEQIELKLKGRQMPRVRYGLTQKKKAFEDMRKFITENPVVELGIHITEGDVKKSSLAEAFEFQYRHGE